MLALLFISKTFPFSPLDFPNFSTDHEVISKKISSCREKKHSK